jgi:hypothetical protein
MLGTGDAGCQLRRMSTKLTLTRKRTIMLAVLAAVALSVTLASSASARTFSRALQMCPNGKICLFEHRNYDGDMVAFNGHIRYLDQYNFEDRASSYINDSGHAFCLYETGNFDGDRMYVPSARNAEWYQPRLSLWGWNDRLSSLSEMYWGMRCT